MPRGYEAIMAGVLDAALVDGAEASLANVFDAIGIRGGLEAIAAPAFNGRLFGGAESRLASILDSSLVDGTEAMLASVFDRAGSIVGAEQRITEAIDPELTDVTGFAEDITYHVKATATDVAISAIVDRQQIEMVTTDGRAYVADRVLRISYSADSGIVQPADGDIVTCTEPNGQVLTFRVINAGVAVGGSHNIPVRRVERVKRAADGYREDL